MAPVEGLARCSVCGGTVGYVWNRVDSTEGRFTWVEHTRQRRSGRMQRCTASLLPLLPDELPVPGMNRARRLAEELAGPLLVPYEGNPNRISEAQRHAIRASLQQHGQMTPVTVSARADGTLVILDGHVRAAEAQALFGAVDVVVGVTKLPERFPVGSRLRVVYEPGRQAPLTQEEAAAVVGLNRLVP